TFSDHSILRRNKVPLDLYQNERDFEDVARAIGRWIAAYKRSDHLVQASNSSATIGNDEVSIRAFRGHMAHVRRTQAKL
ncbi:hypothetical protein OC846_006883, partial [Tilletia horrida]